MGLFGSKKKFGLAEALKAESLAPIPADHAMTGMAILEAVGVPVTAGAEAQEKITELKDSVKETEEGIKAAKTELNVTPGYAAAAIDTLKAELKKLVEAIQKAVLGKVDVIGDAKDAKIEALKVKIDAVRGKAAIKGYEVRVRGEKKTSKIEKKINEKIAEVEANLKSDLADLKDRISDLEADVKSAKAEIGTLEPLAKKWTLPKK